MQAQAHESVKDRGFWHAVGRVAQALRRPRNGGGSGDRGCGTAAALPSPDDNGDRPMIKPSPRERAKILAHRADWP